MAASAAPQQLAAQAWQSDIFTVIYTVWIYYLLRSLNDSNIKIANKLTTQ
jgi:hypothetical protein